MKKNEVLVLRTVNKDMTSKYDGKFLFPKKGLVVCPDFKPTKECGNGLHGLLWGVGRDYLDMNGTWLVLRVKKEDLVDLDNKVKFSRGVVVCCGTREQATQYLYENGGAGKPIYGLSYTAGGRATLTAGDLATLTAGDRATLTAGNYSTLTAGRYSTLTAGRYSTLTAENYSALTAGENSVLTWKIWDGKRYRLHTFYTGENGCEAGKAYKFENGKLMEA